MSVTENPPTGDPAALIGRLPGGELPPDPSDEYPADTPTFGFIWKLALSAVAIRVVFLIAIPLALRVPLYSYAKYGDMESFIRYGQKILDPGIELSEWDKRLFPGFPAAMAGLRLLGVPWFWAGLGLSVAAAAVTVAASAALFRSRVVGLAMLFLPPEWFLYSSSVYSESLTMALMTLGVIAHLRGHALAGGVLLGLAGVVRPMACFAVAGCMLLDVTRRRWGRAATVAAASLGVVLVMFAGLRLLFGDARQPFRSYAHDEYWGGSMISWPFNSFFTVHYQHPTPAWKYVQVSVLTLFILGACALLALRLWRGPRRPLDILCAPWLWGNTLWVLCIGGFTGFHCLPRYILLALGPVFFVYRPLLLRGWRLWPVAALATAAIVLVTARHHGLRHLPPGP